MFVQCLANIILYKQILFRIINLSLLLTDYFLQVFRIPSFMNSYSYVMLTRQDKEAYDKGRNWSAVTRRESDINNNWRNVENKSKNGSSYIGGDEAVPVLYKTGEKIKKDIVITSEQTKLEEDPECWEVLDKLGGDGGAGWYHHKMEAVRGGEVNGEVIIEELLTQEDIEVCLCAKDEPLDEMDETGESIEKFGDSIINELKLNTSDVRSNDLSQVDYVDAVDAVDAPVEVIPPVMEKVPGLMEAVRLFGQLGFVFKPEVGERWKQAPGIR